MDYLQYKTNRIQKDVLLSSFKPCYKWITFNTFGETEFKEPMLESFKPCYKWITFNT